MNTAYETRDLDGISVHSRIVEASGFPSVVFIHADPGSANDWEEVVKRLADRSTVAYDDYGRGASVESPSGDYSYDARAADLGKVIASVGIAKPVLVAHSAGAATALTYALDHPEDLAGLVLVDPLTNPAALPPDVKKQMVEGMKGPAARENFGQYVESIAGKNEAIVNRVVAESRKVEPKVAGSLAETMANWHPPRSLAQLRVPIVFVVASANDNPSSLLSLLPTTTRKIVVVGTGHWIQLEKPEVVVEAITSLN